MLQKIKAVGMFFVGMAKDLVLFIKNNAKKFFLCIALLIALLIIMVTFTNCGFSPVRIEGIPEECNLCYSAMRLYFKATDKSGATPFLKSCQKVLQRERCRIEIFGKEAVSYEDLKKYRNYSECLKELDD